MKKLILLAAGCIFLFACNNEKKEEASATPQQAEPGKAAAEPAAAEITDAKYKDIGNDALAKMQSGDMAGWVNYYADTAVYLWNNGDSLKGKEAISAYWMKRRKETLDTVMFSNAIWLPVKVNKPQSVEAPGTWALGWYMVEAKYKTGKTMKQWMHLDLHFNSADKIDRAIQYRDMVPINAAMAK